MAIKNYTTKVDAYTSIGEIQGALAKFGAKKVMIDYDNGKPVSVAFALEGSFGTAGFKIPAPVDGTLRVFQKQKLKASPEQAEMTAWRNARDWVLAQLALVECCDVPVEQVFLPYLTNRDGQTLYEAYSSGTLMIGE